jgi:hypothetical protein
LDPEASTVILIMKKAYAPWLLILGQLRLRGCHGRHSRSAAFPLWIYHPENPGSRRERASQAQTAHLACPARL